MDDGIGGGADPQDVNTHRLCPALEVSPTVFVVSFGQSGRFVGGVTDEDLPRPRQRCQPGRDVDSVAQRCYVGDGIFCSDHTDVGDA